MSTTTSKGTGNTTEAGGKSWTVEHETKVRFSPKDGKRWADVVDVGDADRARLIAAAPETAAELAALKASNAALVAWIQGVADCYSDCDDEELRVLATSAAAALRLLDKPKCETCGGAGALMPDGSPAQDWNADVAAIASACPDCRPRETTP